MIVFLLMLSFPFGEVIVDVEPEGIIEVDTSLVIRSSGLRTGEILTEKKGIKAIKNLYATGLFKNVELDSRTKGAGINVIIKVKENPRLQSLEFNGNEKISDGDLSSIVDISPPALASDRKIFQVREKILKKYKEEGFSGTEIEMYKEEVEDNRIKVTFEIKEGKKYKVKKISFIGNEGLSDHTLSKVLSNKTKPWWMFWRDDDLKLDSLETDIYRIRALYRKNGYLNASVDSYYVEYENGGARINYVVDEGKIYYFGQVNLMGSEDLGLISRKIKWEEGEIYNEEKIQETMKSLYNYYTNQGYIYASIVPEYSIADDTVVDVTLSIDRGQPVYVKYIKIRGNTKTYDKVIRRNITLYPGDLFNRDKLINSQRNIYRLGYFNNLGMNIENTPSEDSINLVFSVEEMQTGQFNAGFGFSGDIGLTGSIGASIPNLFGTGQSVSFSYERTIASADTNAIQNLRFSWNQPWLFDTPTPFSFSLYNVYSKWNYYKWDRLGGSVSIGRILTADRNLRLSLGYKLEQNELSVSDQASEYLKAQADTSWESSISSDLVFDSRDAQVAPSVGNYYAIHGKYAGNILGGDREYLKLILETRKFHTLIDDFVLMNRARIGYAHAPSGEEVPLTERFFLGGIGNWGLRGYDNRVVSPYSGTYPSGGNFAVLNNLELRYNFSKQSYGMIFMDAGNCFNDIQNARLSDLYYGIGIGFRMQVQMMGIMGIDLGYNINDFRGKGREWKPHFQIGTTF